MVWVLPVLVDPPDYCHHPVVGTGADGLGIWRDVWCVWPEPLWAQGREGVPLRVRLDRQHSAVTNVLAGQNVDEGQVCTAGGTVGVSHAVVQTQAAGTKQLLAACLSASSSP